MIALKKVFLTIIGVIAVGVVLIETQTLTETVRTHECTTSNRDGSEVCFDYSVIESPILGIGSSGKVVVSVNGNSAKFYFWCEYETGLTDSQQFVGGKAVSYNQFVSSQLWTTDIAIEFYKLAKDTACY